MPRETFDQELQRLQDEVLVLGSMVEHAIIESVDTLKQPDREAARRLITQDRVINDKRFAIEADALTLIATQQPLASDLRTIATVLEIATELERMGDYAKGIAKINLMRGDEPLLKPFIHIPRMAEKVRDMLHRALEAFAQRDASLACAIPGGDEEIDELHNQVYRELLTLTMADKGAVDQATQLLWVAHNLERVADRAVNICERVVFTVTGEMVEMDVENGWPDSGMAGVT
jgi:phosphate transport system protein